MGTSKRNIATSSNHHKLLPHSTPAAAASQGELPPANGQPATEQPSWTADADFERLKARSFLTTTTKPMAVPKVVARKPKGQEYFRVRPGVEWRGQYGLLRDQRTDTLYVVVPELHGELADEFAYHIVVTAVNLQGEVFLWPIPMADSSGRSNSWWETAAEAAQRAETVWVRLKSDTDRGRYDIREAQYELPEPQWPAQSFGELFRLAFKDVVIANLEHPFVRRLRGAL